jgi:hypothetical protein
MKIVFPLVVVCGLSAAFASTAFAQPPVEVPQEVTERVNLIAQEFGLTKIGSTILRQLDDGDHETIDITVSSDRLTLVALEGDQGVIELDVRATANGNELASESGTGMPVLQIPAGNGSTVQVTVEMSCEEMYCSYFVQSFVR